MNPSTFWDPAGIPLEPNELKEANDSIQKQSIFVRRTKYIRILTILFLLLVLGVIIIVFWLFRGNPKEIGMSVIFPALPFILSLVKIGGMRDDLVKHLIANQKGWLYWPKEDVRRWEALKKTYPDIFNSGNKYQCFEDEFWGNYDGKHSSTPFWLSNFSFTVGLDTYSFSRAKTAFAFLLEKSVPTTLTITPETAGTKIAKFLGQGDLDLESREFNKLFRLQYGTHDSHTESEVFRLLNPAVMHSLLELHERFGRFSLTFVDNVMIGTLGQNCIRAKYTNFLKSPEIDSRDIAHLEDIIETLISQGNEIASRLD